VCATDPFHDTEVRCDGYPDVTTAKSVVQVVTQTVSVPVYTGGLGAWDCQVFFAPLTPCFSQDDSMHKTTTTTTANEKRTTYSTGRQVSDSKISSPIVLQDTVEHLGMPPIKSGGGVVRDTNVVSRVYYKTTVDESGHINQTGSGFQVNAGWNIKTGPVGFDIISGSVGTDNFGLALPPQFCTGAWRLLSTGLEVVNTTAMLYKGGSVTSYRSPSCQIQGLTLSVPEIQSLVGQSVGLTPPANQQQAALYPNSKTWEAEKGVYLIATLQSNQNPLYCPLPGIGGIMTPSSLGNLEDGDGWIGYFPKIQMGHSMPSAACSTLPFDVSGSVFGGLNNQTTLQITARYYIERHPTIADPDILVLARTPAPYDPVVLELYSRVLNELPVAVPVGENPLGEWFNDILDGVAEWAPKIGTFLGNAVPGAALIGKVVGTAAGAAHKKRTVVVETAPQVQPKKAHKPQQQQLTQPGSRREKKGKKKKKKQQGNTSAYGLNRGIY